MSTTHHVHEPTAPTPPSAAVSHLQAQWEELARRQDYWAKAGQSSPRWDADAFLAVGRREVDDVLDNVTRLFPHLGRDAALDFGCGTGRLTLPLAESFARVVGVDISAEQVRRATAAAAGREGVELHVNASGDLSLLSDASVDLVLAHVVLQHMTPALALGYLAEFHRVLRPGGVAVFTEPSVPRLTAGGVAFSVLPRSVVQRLKRRRYGLVMEMHPIAHDELARHLVRIGYHPPVLQPSDSAGPNFTAFRYFAQKPVAPPAQRSAGGAQP